MGLSPLSFTGVSSFSDSFNQILTRATQIASLPLESLQNQKTDLLQREALAAGLQGQVAALTSSFETLASVGDRAGITGASSDPAKVRIASVTATSAASYTLSEITSVASAASETSVSGFATSNQTPVSSTGSVRLTVGSQTFDLSLSAPENNLVGLRDKINALGAGVTATIFTTGTGSDPNFLSVTANATGATTLSLRDDPAGANVNLLTATNQGTNAVFKLNGVSVSKSSNTVNDVVSGLAFTIAGTTTGSETVRLSLASDRSQLSTALQSFVSAYNGVVDFLDGQIGESAGLLTGSNLIFSTSTALRSIAGFSGGGSLKTLADLGVSFDSKGKASFDTAAFGAISESQLPAAFRLAGTSVDGLGSLAASVRSLSDPVSGLIQAEISQYGQTETRLNSQIDQLSSRLNAQQEALRLRLQAADALLSQLESQRNVLSAQIESLNLTLYGKRES